MYTAESSGDIVILQSFRNYDVPNWIKQCQGSVKTYARQHGWNYKFLGDEIFDYAPAWARTVCAENIWSLSDICRLEWIKSELTVNAKIAIWADIDIFIFQPEFISLNFENEYGFAYQLWFSSDGMAHHGVNNAFMFFKLGTKMLDYYLRRSYEELTSRRADLRRTSVGPDLVANIGIDENHTIGGLNILNFRAIKQIFADPEHNIPDYILGQTRGRVGGVNLCLNERRFFSGRERQQYDYIIDYVVRAFASK